MPRPAALALLAIAAVAVAALVFAPYGAVEPVVPVRTGAVPVAPVAPQGATQAPPTEQAPTRGLSIEQAPTEALSPEAEARRAYIEAKQQRREQPDVKRLAVQQSTWNAVHYLLASRDTPEAQALADELRPLVRDMQAAHTSPDHTDLALLQARQDAARRQIEASGLVDDALRAQLSRLDQARAPQHLDD